MLYQNVHIFDVLGSIWNLNWSQGCLLWNIWVPVHCRNLVWHNKHDDTNASPMTTDTSRSLMTETSQLNRHIRGSAKNTFGVIVYRYLNSHYPFSHFIPHGYWNVTSNCWALTKAAFCCLGACSQFAQSKLTSTAHFARQNAGEHAVSLVRPLSGQKPSRLSLTKGLENGPRSPNVKKSFATVPGGI